MIDLEPSYCTRCKIEIDQISGHFFKAIDKSGCLCEKCYDVFNKYLHDCYLNFIKEKP